MKNSLKVKKQIYLINPKNLVNFWTMDSSVKALGAKSMMPNNSLATIAALTPKDLNIEYSYCDENISRIKFNKRCDLVAITGFKLHAQRIAEISAQFRKRGIPVAIGGPYATLYPDEGRKIADFLFVGEAEYTWPRFLREWIEGTPQNEYIQTEFVDMSRSPAPDWSFVKSNHYLYYTVQTSRGCPHNCDFCDVKGLVGRRYRTKSIEQIMHEINNAYEAGAETIFFSEDNFFVNKKFTVKLLNKIIDWNTQLPRPVSFSAQATIRVGDDEEILKLMADARFSVLFLGVESIRKECLDEVNKGHLFKFNPVKSVSRISSYGILPFIGLIVGFDNDDRNSFRELNDFLEETNSPIASVSVLNAPEKTALYSRLRKEGRLVDNFHGVWHFTTNIIPRSMTMRELLGGHRTLFQGLYSPENFEKRALGWLKNIRYFTPLYTRQKVNFYKLFKFFFILKFYLFNEPKEVRGMFFRLLRETWRYKPRLFKKAVTILSQYCHYYDFSHNKLPPLETILPEDDPQQKAG